MNGFDERFADRAREVFDSYAEPVDEPTWERVQASLAKTRTPAPDRAPVAGAWTRRSRALVALATLLLVGGVGTWAVWQTVNEAPDAPTLAANTDTPRSTPVAPPPAPPEATAAREMADATETPSTAQHGATPRASGIAAPRSTRQGATRQRDARQEAPSPVRSVPAPASARSEPEFLARAVPPADDPIPTPTPLAPSPAARSSLLSDEAVAEAPREETLDAAAPAPPHTAGAPAVTRQNAREPELADIALGDVAETDPTGLGVDLVLATNAAFSGRQLAEGVGLTAGLSREWHVRNGLAISTGALAAYSRLETDPNSSVSEAFTTLQADPSRSINVPDRTTLSTLALEIPVDVILDLADTGPGRFRAGVGLTTSLYLSQTFDDEGSRYALDSQTDINGEVTPTFTADAYSESETAGPLSHLDFARQANVSLGYTLDRGRTPLSLDAYTRLPLGGVTSRDLELTLVGLRLRIGL